MSMWKEYVLNDYIKVKHGFAFKGEYFSDEKNENILLTPGNFKIGGGFKSEKFKYYTGYYPADYILKEGDVIITMTDLSKAGDTLGYAAKIPKHENINYLHNQRLGLVEFKKDGINKDFLYWVLRTKEYQYFILGSSTGSTVKHTSPSRIQSYTFSAPESLEEQHRIAEILTSLDDKIELNNQMNQTLESIAQAIFKEWFVDFRFPGFDGELVDGLPKGWRMGKVGEISNIRSGKYMKRQEFIEYGKYSVIGANGEVGKSDDFLFDDSFIITGRVGTIGNVTISYGKKWYSDNVLLIKPTISFFHFLYFSLKLENIKSLNRGSTQPLITQTDLKNLEIKIPTNQLMNDFDLIMNSIFEKIKINNENNQVLVELRNTLLPKLMSGKISVN